MNPSSGALGGSSGVLLERGSDPAPRSHWELFRRRFLKHRLGVFGGIILVALTVLCFGADWWWPRDRINPLILPEPPSADHWFGIDQQGRDYFAETLSGGQISLRIGLTVAFISTFSGVLIGSLAGYFRGWIDQLLMRITDLFLVVPQLVILAVALKKFGQDQVALSLILASIFWMSIARITRGQVLQLREREFVEAARAAGASSARVIVRHILPNLIGPICVNATLAVAAAVVSESTLSFLGYGLQVPDVSWGTMISDAKGFVDSDKSFLLYFPGIAILLVVLSINFLGDGLRDALDPQADRR
jgi:peptide/nickel transport system permease protein